ncbi:inositol hexakisphosphate and diphosphoinositol-pentakisphosphate kinase [Entomophthora muscae]|uniref:Inositol hexakisphosphate and diphosphoinositol-pentakisphosphate kinase n=1 Tax=Entomophthora muscae TaxID=34485 RepID=A0ACC2TQ27_9FUNG|nr:inositol hexakisphosphate and diphosphoinositol-pentakisphosphate kinase [Entomophthora muscae]
MWNYKVLWDRRAVLGILEAIGVPTPRRLVVSRDGGPSFSAKVLAKLPTKARQHLESLHINQELKIIDQDTIEVNGKRLTKPFVEKPVSGEDHNINIYYPSSAGGGTRRLFRKVANKSSEFLPDQNSLRTDGSYIYEEFVDVDNAEDIKVYTVGPDFAHAETRKSPVVDGIVRRNVDGKEMRFVTELSVEETEMAQKICLAFGQTVCGLDLLRAGGQSFVIDVNGWSFVKGNVAYYDLSSKILLGMFQSAAKRRWFSFFMAKEPTFENTWTLKGFVSVFRHADRTPKQKAKFKMLCAEISQLLQGSTDELILRKPEELASFREAVERAITSGEEENRSKLLQMRHILEKKGELPGTKVQIKPNKDPASAMQVIIKWGGEFTHAAVHHSTDLGENMRKDLTIINRALLEDVRIFSSSERRVLATAEAFSKPFLALEDIPGDLIQVKKGMLDDSNDAKEQMDIVKAELREVLHHSPLLKPIHFGFDSQHPKELVAHIKKLLIDLRGTMRTNLTAHGDLTQAEWCCSENPQLFLERWEKLIKEFCDGEAARFDPGKVCELYDSLKYDALHNRDFMEEIFTGPNDGLTPLRELYRAAKIFFDMIAPREYGISPREKLSIGMLTSRNLLDSIVKELEAIRDSAKPASRLYFTKESHVHTLLNIVLNCRLPLRLKHEDVGELDYLTQITFELYECQREGSDEKQWSLRLGFSPGAHHSFIMDLQMDDRHALSVASRRDLTDHIDLGEALGEFHSLLERDFKVPLAPTIELSSSLSAASPLLSPIEGESVSPLEPKP